MCLYIGNKNGMEHLIKKFSAMDMDERVIKTFEIDVDQTGPTTKEGFEAIYCQYYEETRLLWNG